MKKNTNLTFFFINISTGSMDKIRFKGNFSYTYAYGGIKFKTISDP